MAANHTRHVCLIPALNPPPPHSPKNAAAPVSRRPEPASSVLGRSVRFGSVARRSSPIQSLRDALALIFTCAANRYRGEFRIRSHLSFSIPHLSALAACVLNMLKIIERSLSFSQQPFAVYRLFIYIHTN